MVWVNYYKDNTMTFIDMPGLEDAKEPVAVPEGKYDLCIIDAKLTEKEGKKSVRLIMEIEGEPEAGNVFHYVGLPAEDDDADKRKTKMLFARRFFNQFNINTDGGFEMEQLVGSRASAAMILQEEYEGDLRNSLKTNKLPTEED